MYNSISEGNAEYEFSGTSLQGPKSTPAVSKVTRLSSTRVSLDNGILGDMMMFLQIGKGYKAIDDYFVFYCIDLTKEFVCGRKQEMNP
ncbi:hypothetical protein TNCV_4598901 [Trichonephila clavipes]|nr:hypothetical protein TNCV_4598901 [Trichonephila clavipes]